MKKDNVAIEEKKENEKASKAQSVKKPTKKVATSNQNKAKKNPSGKKKEIESKNEMLLISQSSSMIEAENNHSLNVSKIKAPAKTHDKNNNSYDRETANKADSLYRDFSDLAFLMGTSIEQLKDDVFYFEIRKIMANIEKVVVRYDVQVAEIHKMFADASLCGMGGIAVAPVHLQTCSKHVKKNKITDVKYMSLVDFPFGESAVKGKISNIKESWKMGATEVAISMPSMLLNPENFNKFKKQVKKYSKIRKSKKGTGIILNAGDLTEQNFTRAMKILSKTKIAFVALAFGEANLEEIQSKLALINKYAGSKKVYVIANVASPEAAMLLFKQDVKKILTPYADEIGYDLLRRFDLEKLGDNKKH